MLTIEDIRNPRRKSGFNYVSLIGGTSGRGGRRYWRAEKGNKKKEPRFEFRGTSRATPEEAAQDYCDYVNSSKFRYPGPFVRKASEYSRATPATQILRRVSHASRDQIERDEEMQAALGVLRDKRAQRQGKDGAVYLIGELGDKWYAVKIGYSVKPEARAGELQTGNPRPLRLLASMPGTLEDERALHAKYSDKHILGEWFEADDELLAEFGISKDGR